MIPYHGTGEPDYIRIWRGQRYLTCRCSKCGHDFYAEEPQQGLEGLVLPGDRMIDDEDELREAEEEIKRRADEEGDHRY